MTKVMLILATLASLSSAAHATTITLPCGKRANVLASIPLSNGGKRYALAGGGTVDLGVTPVKGDGTRSN